MFRMRFLRSSGLPVKLRSLLVLTLISLLCTLAIKLYWYKDEAYTKMHRTLRIHQFCGKSNETELESASRKADLLTSWGVAANKKSTSHVVIVSRKSSANKEFRNILESLKIKYKYFTTESHFQDLLQPKYRKIHVFIFDDLNDYYDLKQEVRNLLDQYCRKNRAGIIGLTWHSSITKETTNYEKPPYIAAKVEENLDENLFVHNDTIITLLKSPVPHTGYTDFLEFSWFSGTLDVLITAGKHPIVLHEPSQINAIPKIIICRHSLSDWVFKSIVMDSLQYLSNNKINFPRTRYIQIDIDDIFVGAARLTKEDVVALMQSQYNIAKHVPGFRYNLGFSGSTYKKGTYHENEGDELLIEFKDKFAWFPHMWRHIQPHKFDNVTELVIRMQKNYNFAVEKSLPVNSGYSVAPHHSGVYPVHEQLYTAWKQVWNIKATSSEEYPSLYPSRKRKGFIYRNISVLPRQTCGLFTKNLYYDEYPGGTDKLEQSLAGGEILDTILTNPISVFMTHMPNYCCDRLAPYLFESLLNFAKCFTNLEFVATEPVKLANKYFDLFADEKKPVWSNPCLDKRHIEIYSQNKSCNQLPNFLVVGPQKTGSTALYSFLKLHPNIISNELSENTFEEVQFFNEKYYYNGLDWYKSFFPVVNSSTTVMFEKSATYFDAENVPLRAHKLLPVEKIVIILIPPEDRAYSWYQHMKAHNQPTSLNNTFDKVIKASFTSSKDVLSLKSRCLEPGKYALHINRWLMYYRPKQIYIMDGLQLKKDPVTAINKLQKFLQVPFVDYKSKLMFDSKKGFFCAVVNGKKKCLGKGKGRGYPPLEPEIRSFLENYYKQHNSKLLELLNQHGFPIPDWLNK